jgi:MscS family membrane protein
MKVQHFCRALLLLLASLGTPCAALAQLDDVANPVETEQQDHVRFDQRTPLATVQGFMRAAELGDYELASTYLDLRYLPDELTDYDGTRLAERLYIVVARKLRVDFDSLSNDPEGLADDDLPSYRDELGEIATPRGTMTLYLQRIPGANNNRIWRISNATVAQIPELYERFGYSPLVEKVRQAIPAGSFLGAELFKWVFAIIAAAAAALGWLALAWPASRLITPHRLARQSRVRHYLTRPIPWAIFILVGSWTIQDLGLGLTASRIAQGGTLVTLVAVWLLFATMDLLRDLYATYLETRGRESGLMLVRPVTSTIKVVVALLAITIWLDNIGVNVTALVAGLGVGGLAVALVLQRPLEDIMGAVTLYTQQPVSIGQFCTAGNVSGTIEEISLRSTRIRKLDNNVVIIPNAIFATASIENVSERRRILHRQMIRLAQDTTQTEIRQLISNLREAIGNHARVIADAWRVNFIEFGEYSKNIEVFAHINTTDWQEFLTIAEDINLVTLGVLEETGVLLAVPPR